MNKSPNRDDKKYRQARNCLACDNGDWTYCRGSQCRCQERGRTAGKRRFEKELESGEHDCCMFGVPGHVGVCTHNI